MLSNRTTDLLDAIDAIETVDEIWEEAGRYLGDVGVSHFIYSVRDRDSGRIDVRTNLPEDWRRHYQEEGYASVDPFFRYCCSSYQPVPTGPEYLDLHDFLTADERQFVQEGGEAGFRSGISSPIGLNGQRLSGGWNFGTGLRKREFESIIREFGDSVRLAGFCVHQRCLLQKSRDGRRAPTPKLTPRERDCLSWLSRGLRTAAIADALGIADVTVDLHLKGARQKLNAATREEALAKAITHGLISP